jgi:GMP synthase-like glutamine amidotransferase
MKRIGILETGATPSTMREQFGTYAAMFEHLLGPDTAAYSTFDVRAGVFPAEPEACDAYIVTGSAAGAYDPDPWIGDLIGFLREAKGRAGLVGVCFGHQVMAQAFGGKVIKSPKGWGIGLHTYGVREHRPWMDAAPQVAVAASHQDQVVELPPGALVVAASEFTPYAMLEYTDQPAISIQPHPEFEPAYAAALIEGRRGIHYSETAADAAIASLKAPNDNARLARWITDFLERS